MRRTVLVPAAAAIALLAATLAPAAQAADPTVVAEGLVSPLSLAVADDGSVFVSQNFAGALTKVPFGGEPTQVFADEAQREVGAVSVSGTVVTFATTGDPMKPDARLWTLDSEGTQTLVANLGAHEKKNNADAEKTYGIGHLGKECTQAIPRSKRAGIVPYGGIVESHPYASYVDGATTYVADAAANAI